MDIFATLSVAPILDYTSETVQVLGLQILKGEALVVIFISIRLKLIGMA